MSVGEPDQKSESYPCFLLQASLSELGNAGERAQKVQWEKVAGLTNTDTSQSQNHGYELAHPNIHFIYELLEHMKRINLQTENCRISMTQDNWITKWISGENHYR